MKKILLALLFSFALLSAGCVSEEAPVASPTPLVVPSPVPSPSLEAPSPEPSPIPSPAVSVIPLPSPVASIPNITEFKTQVEKIAFEVLGKKVRLDQSWDNENYYAIKDFTVPEAFELMVRRSIVNNWKSTDSLFTATGLETNRTKQYKRLFKKVTDSHYDFEGTLYCYDWDYELFFFIRQSVDHFNPDLKGDEKAMEFLGKAIDICP
ncbi:MAG: hypothetical protein V1834_04665 [Candidatus Micrarchaeota archaeon]